MSKQTSKRAGKIPLLGKIIAIILGLAVVAGVIDAITPTDATPSTSANEAAVAKSTEASQSDAPSAKAPETPSTQPEAETVDEAPLDPETPEGADFEPELSAEAGTLGTETALAVLEQLDVKGRAPKTGYDRQGKFGTAWLDVDRNGCDTRNDILQRDLTQAVLEGPCKVMSGVLADPYTATTIQFVRGNTTSILVQIDHVVALSDAWQKGAQQLTQEQRIAFANDPLNLFATDGPTNSAKGDGDAATWLPPNRAFRCEYVARQISVKAAYGLWVTSAEKTAMANVLASCPDQLSYASGFVAVVAPAVNSVADQPAPPTTQPVTEAPPAPPPPAPTTAPPVVEPPNVHYKNCTEAREAGVAPIYRGQPGYASHLDRDNDGIACE